MIAGGYSHLCQASRIAERTRQDRRQRVDVPGFEDPTRLPRSNQIRPTTDVGANDRGTREVHRFIHDQAPGLAFAHRRQHEQISGRVDDRHPLLVLKGSKEDAVAGTLAGGTVVATGSNEGNHLLPGLATYRYFDFVETGTGGGQNFLITSISGTLGTDPNGPGVPEPASWALMLLGFGGIGAKIRRRRATRLAT